MIHVDDAGFRYGRGPWVFRHHSFCLERGRVLTILGPNGRGKTSLLKCLLGLQKLQEGSVRVDGKVGYVPQVQETGFPYDVLDVVLMGRTRHVGLFSSPKPADYEIAWEALSTVGMADFAHRPLNTLSGGERQMVLIARALASQCDLLVLDEPTSALDLRNQRKVLSILRKLAHTGMTLALTTHDPQHARFVADRVLLMYAPEQFLYGPADEVMVDDNLQRLYGVDVCQVVFQHRGRHVETVVPVYD